MTLMHLPKAVAAALTSGATAGSGPARRLHPVCTSSKAAPGTAAATNAGANTPTQPGTVPKAMPTLGSAS